MTTPSPPPRKKSKKAEDDDEHDAVQKATQDTTTAAGEEEGDVSSNPAPTFHNNQSYCWYSVKCHCGTVKGKFKGSTTSITAWNCNCSDCIMRGNIHVIIPQDDFRLDMMKTIRSDGNDDDDDDHDNNTDSYNEQQQIALLEEATTLYLWGTKTAQRRFCKTCGILPWYRPRSNPDGYGITLHCIDWKNTTNTDRPKPNIVIKEFDGDNWEQFFQTSNISEQSKKQN